MPRIAEIITKFLFRGLYDRMQALEAARTRLQEEIQKTKFELAHQKARRLLWPMRCEECLDNRKSLYVNGSKVTIISRYENERKEEGLTQ